MINAFTFNNIMVDKKTFKRNKLKRRKNMNGRKFDPRGVK